MTVVLAPGFDAIKYQHNEKPDDTNIDEMQ